MRKSWVIIGLVVVGGLYYWSGEEEQPETVSKPAPPKAGNAIGPYGRIPDQPRQTRDRQWGSTGTIPAQDREEYNALTPAPEYGGYLPPYQEHSFRPLNEGKKSLTRRKPMTTPAYPTIPEWQRNYQAPPDRGYQVYEAPAYDAFPERSQAAPMPGYRFRPQDSQGQPDRWIGNYPRIPSTGPTSPIRSYPPEPKANYAFSW